MADQNSSITFQPKPTTYQFKDIEGQKFGRLTVTRYVEQRKRRAHWLCRCECGNELIVSGKHLRNGHTQSCGCLKVDKITTHGQGGTPGKRTDEYRIWNGMMVRCHSPSAHPLYGGRGIQVCERWRQFKNFFSDMGKRPSPKHSIDRIDTNGHYEPGNCRWATQVEQANNTRTNRILEWHGESRTVAEWARHLGVNPSMLINRLHKGWNVHDTLSLPTTPFSLRRKVKHSAPT